MSKLGDLEPGSPLGACQLIQQPRQRVKKKGKALFSGWRTQDRWEKLD